ncbi:MAG: hypothetical protein ACRDA3_00875 [Peptostreptococcaceae bacterium]
MDLVEVVIYVFVYIFLIPVLVIMHELGHGIVALITSKEKVDVVIGDSNLGIKFKMSRFTIYFRRYKSFLGISLDYVRFISIYIVLSLITYNINKRLFIK